MPIALLVLYGSMGGLASVLVSAVLRPLFAGTPASSASRSQLSVREVLEAGSHMFAGAGVAALYWLSWGFAAVVEVPWWVRGLAFGIACWMAIALPVLLALALQLRLRATTLAMLAFDWTATCLLAALACAWSWATSP